MRSLIVLACCVASVAYAQREADDERARRHFQAGSSYFQEGAYDSALVEFNHAYELSQRAPLLLTLAIVLERLGRHAEAAARIRDYLRRVPDAADRPMLERRMHNLDRLAAGAAPDPTPAPTTTNRSGGNDGWTAAWIASFAT